MTKDNGRERSLTHGHDHSLKPEAGHGMQMGPSGFGLSHGMHEDADDDNSHEFKHGAGGEASAGKAYDKHMSAFFNRPGRFKDRDWGHAKMRAHHTKAAKLASAAGYHEKATHHRLEASLVGKVR